MFNPLPIFHCFGLTGGVLLPILTGMKAFQYPSPLHIKQIPPLIQDSQRHHPAGHRHLRQPVRPLGRARRAVGPEVHRLRRREGARRDPQPDRRAVRPDPRAGGLRRHRGLAGDRGQQAGGQRPRHRRRPAARRWRPGWSRSTASPRGGRLYVRGPNVMAGYLRRRRRARAPAGRLARHRRRGRDQPTTAGSRSTAG